MNSKFELSVGLAEPRWREGALGLLVPLPPATPHQRPGAHTAPEGWKVQAMVALNGRQRALWITEAPDLGRSLLLGLEDASDLPDPAPYAPVMNRFTKLPAGLQPVVAELKASARSEADLVQRAADYVASRFRYDPTPSTGAFPDVACDIRQGNCLDVNTVFLSILYAAGIRACYDIGYYFLDDSRTCDGWHCWVSVIADGRHEDWDVPHYLKFDVGPIGPGLNPRPGRRFCMSRGRGLRYEVAGVEVEISHFCRPRWILPDGSSGEAPITASWTQP